MSLTEYKAMEPATPLIPSLGTPGNKRSLLETKAVEWEKMDETLSECQEEMVIGATSCDEIVPGNYSPGNTRELLQNLGGEDWADNSTPPLGSPRKNLELKLGNEPSNMGMVLLNDEAREKNNFEGNKWTFLNMLDKKRG